VLVCSVCTGSLQEQKTIRVVCVVHFCKVKTCHCSEPLEKLVDPPNQCTTPITSSKQPRIKMETRSNVFSPFSSPKPMVNTLRTRRVKSSSWFFFIETKGVTTKTQPRSSFHKSFSRRGSNIEKIRLFPKTSQ